jgi:four helix bundle protein
MEQFGYEKLEVYQASVEFLKLAYLVGDGLPRGYAVLADQLRRSSLSIPLNIAEGTGKSYPADRRKYYQIARGSALECSAIINSCLTLKICESSILDDSRLILYRIVQMLSKLARR